MAGEAERRRIFSELEERFGIPQGLFGGYLLFKRKSGWWLLKNESPVMAASHLKVWKTGMKAFQRVGAFVKPTTKMIQVFGAAATRARFDFSEQEVASLLEGGELPGDPGLANGYVILATGGFVLGLGLLIGGKIRSQLPRKAINQAMLARRDVR